MESHAEPKISTKQVEQNSRELAGKSGILVRDDHFGETVDVVMCVPLGRLVQQMARVPRCTLLVGN